MKKIIYVLILFPMFAIGQSGYNSYYKSGKLKISGQGFIEENKWKVSAESGLI